MSNNHYTREEVYLAALLHDIGKFWQRADESFEKSNKLNKDIKNLIEYVCPKDSKNKFGYLHVLWTAQFFHEFFDKNLLGENKYEDKNSNNLFALATYHHYPATDLQAIISLADSCSALADRLEEIEHDTEITKWQNLNYKNTPLVYPFYLVRNIDPEDERKFEYVFHLKTMNKDCLFPVELNKWKNNYIDLWKNFYDEVQNITKIYNEKESLRSLSETMFFLLKKYAWCIPSATNEAVPVTPLFDHLKTTAAFADCLYEYYQTYPETFEFIDTHKGKKIKISENSFPVLFVGGDISGIQSYIYDIHRNKAAKSLKGRSFFVQMLVDSIIQKIINHNDIKAHAANVLYSAGGKFYLFLPNTQKVVNSLNEIHKEIEYYLWNEHKGKISYLQQSIEFKINLKNSKNEAFEISNGQKISIAQLWKTLADKLEENKYKKFVSIIKKDNNFFEPFGAGGDSLICSVTGDEINDKEIKYLDKENKELPVLKAIYEQVKLGEVLKDADFLINYFNKSENNYLTNRAKINVKITDNVNNYLFDKKELIKEDADFRTITSADDTLIYRFNDTNFIVALKGKRASYGFRFYAGNKQAKTDDNNQESRDRTFAELTYYDFMKNFPVEVDINEDLDPSRHTYLAILRMDVDGLGNLFAKRLSNEYSTFSIYSSISFMLDWFFSGYLNEIRNDEKYRNNVNIIYAGGDDLFVVGRWDKVIGFAYDVREKFHEYVKREDITISGGITIVSPKFPISKAATLAGEAEDKAKYEFNEEIIKNKNRKIPKNAISIYDIPLQWDDFKIAKDLKEKLVEFVEEETLSKGFIQKLLQFYQMKCDAENKNESPRYIWNAVYTVSRYIERYKDKEGNIKPEYEKVAKFLTGRKGDTDSINNSLLMKLLVPDNYNVIAVASRWAELELRDLEKIKKQTEKPENKVKINS